MNFFRSPRGPYVCFRPIGDFSATQLVQFKQAISSDLTDGRAHIAIDLRKILSIDNTGLRFLRNLYGALKPTHRKLSFFGGTESLRAKLEADAPGAYEIFETIEDFEFCFHETDKMTYHNYFELGHGNGELRTLHLACPICRNDKIRGFVFEREKLTQEWTEELITPVWVDLEEEDTSFDVDAYAVAVCNSCFFASTRIDWFDIMLKEGFVESILSTDQRERIANKIAMRKDFAMEHPSITSQTFFGFPRERRAAYVSWHLNEMTCRDVARDKANTDGFDIAFSNLMICKFTEDNRVIEERLDTCLAWLHGVLKNPERYSTARLVSSYVYIISVYLAKGRYSDALKHYNDLLKREDLVEEYSFWFERAREIIQEERDS